MTLANSQNENDNNIKGFQWYSFSMREKALPGLVLALTGLAPIILYLPAIKLTLFGDDFLLVQLAHRAEHSFPLLFASLDAFYRPTTTWTLILDRSIWGTFAGGFHLTNILQIGRAHV